MNINLVYVFLKVVIMIFGNLDFIIYVFVVEDKKVNEVLEKVKVVIDGLGVSI